MQKIANKDLNVRFVISSFFSSAACPGIYLVRSIDWALLVGLWGYFRSSSPCIPTVDFKVGVCT